MAAARIVAPKHYSSQEDIWCKINVDAPDNFQPAYQVRGWLSISVLPLTAVASRNLLPLWVFKWIVSLAIYLSLKWLTWWRARSRIAHAAWRSVAYPLACAGMDADAFLDARQQVSPPAARPWLWATFETILGAILFWVGRGEVTGRRVEICAHFYPNEGCNWTKESGRGGCRRPVCVT